MIDNLTIFSKSGTVLYSYNGVGTGGGGGVPPSSSLAVVTVPTNALNQLITTVLLENRHTTTKSCTLLGCSSSSSSAASTASSETTTTGNKGAGGGAALVAEWEEGGPRSMSSSENKRSSVSKDWVAVALYKEVLKSRFGYVRELLRSTLHEYAIFHDSVVTRENTGYPSVGDDDDEDDTLFAAMSPHIPPPDPSLFHATFTALLRKAEKSTRNNTPSSSSSHRPPAVSTGSTDEEDEEEEEEGSLMSEEDEDESASGGGGDGEDDNDDGPVDTSEGLKRLKERRERALNKNRGNKPGKESAASEEMTKKGKKKKNTVWHDGTGKVTKEDMERLDMSKKKDGGGGGDGGAGEADVRDDSRALAEARAAYLPTSEEVPSWEEVDTVRDEDLNLGGTLGSNTTKEDGGGGGWFKGLIDQMSGNKVLTEDDIAPILEELKSTLVSKNVASDIATEICVSVHDSLIGKRLQSFGRIKTAVRVALEKAIARILTPHRDIDVLREVVAKRESQRRSGGRPYVIVMVGINGVGKSTSLAKITYYLKTNGCNPMIAACDTFRSGAVEQLSVHAKCLEVPLFDRGYAKDPSSVARAAITDAESKGYDVVLVDTAGRMQNNVPLMRALSKLIVENRPDLVLFVGEALVGNDGIDQLRMFDQAFRTGGHDRNIDGIVLTKFDTVSDKVGAALTMTHITGQPVVFVGTGQKYNHLKKLSVPSVIKSLFS